MFFIQLGSDKSKSRIPRPISLPKRLEAKLGSKSPSPVRSKTAISPQTKPPLGSNTGQTRKSRVRFQRLLYVLYTIYIVGLVGSNLKTESQFSKYFKAHENF